MHVETAGFRPKSPWMVDTRYTFTSPLEPSADGNCVAMIYLRDQKPWWRMYPCGYQISSYWICKKRPRTRNVIQWRGYPSLMCKIRSLEIQEVCYEYGIINSFQNDSVDLQVENPYLVYLDQILAYHGIEITFVARCNVIKTYKNKMQGEFALPNDVPKSMISKERKFQIQETAPHYTMCGPTMQQCYDKSCRAQLAICKFDFECAPYLCACRIGNQMKYSVEYCRYLCPPQICMCAPLMFQCSTGGCIPYAYICDNVYDCADTSDEFCVPNIADRFETYRLKSISATDDSQVSSIKSSRLCFDFICLSGICIDIQLVNDLIPDCVDADEESHSLSIKYDGLSFRCKDVEDIPCFPGHSKCFGINRLCLYDRDNYDHISYCRDGAHLRNCRHIHCTNAFKCPLSYCIPLRKVCDGIKDCYNGEDEHNCHKNICSGYLKCQDAEFCIHPTEVCDGYTHCPHGDDEELCDIVGCPSECTCLGHSAWCRDERFSYIPKVPFRDIKYLSVGWNNTNITTFANLSLLSTLIILDLSRSTLFSICPAFQTDHNFYKSLLVLYLEHNNISYLSSTCFTMLLSILVISLQGNPLTSIADDAFRGGTLSVLVIRNTCLRSLSNEWINGFHGLKILDIRGVELVDLPKTTTNRFYKLDMINTDDVRLCCVLKNVHGCYEDMRTRTTCHLLSHSIVGPMFILLASTISVCITISMWRVYRLFANSRPSQYLIHTSILLNRLLCVCYILAIAIIDIIHGEHYIFWCTTLSCRFSHQVLYIIISSGMVMYNISTSLLDYITQMAVTGMLTITGSARVRLFLFSSQIFVITAFTMLITLTHNLFNNHVSANRLCSTQLGLPFSDFNWLRVGSVIIATIILISFAYSILAKIVIFAKTYSSGIRVQSMASTDIDSHRTRLIRLLSTLCHSAVFRSLECLPTMSLVFLTVCGTDISLETQLVSILTSVSFGCLYNTTAMVWKRMFSQKQI